MKNLFDKQPISTEAPQGLRNRVELAARQKPRRDWFAPRYRWAIAGTGVAAAAVAGVMLLTPASAEAKTWDMVQKAYEDVRGMLIELEFNDSASEQGKMTIAGKGNDWRVSFDGIEGGGPEKMDISYTGGELTIWDGGDTAKVISLGMQIPFSPEQLMQNLTKELTASHILEDNADEIGRNNIRIEQPVWVDGRHVYNVYINEPNGEGKFHLLVDADTDLPISMNVDGPNGESFRMKFQFNSDFDDSLLQPILPSGIKFEQMDASKMGGDGEDFFRGLEEFGKEMERKHGGHDSIEIKQVKIESAVLAS
jgi:hypothetical protein